MEQGSHVKKVRKQVRDQRNKEKDQVLLENENKS